MGGSWVAASKMKVVSLRNDIDGLERDPCGGELYLGASIELGRWGDVYLSAGKSFP